MVMEYEGKVYVGLKNSVLVCDPRSGTHTEVPNATVALSDDEAMLSVMDKDEDRIYDETRICVIDRWVRIKVETEYNRQTIVIPFDVVQTLLKAHKGIETIVMNEQWYAVVCDDCGEWLIYKDDDIVVSLTPRQQELLKSVVSC